MRYAEYVGARQWAALLAAEDAWPHPVRWGYLREAVAETLAHRNTSGTVESLLTAGMLRHDCTADDHSEGLGCYLKITPSGRDARLNRRGRLAAGSRV